MLSIGVSSWCLAMLFPLVDATREVKTSDAESPPDLESSPPPADREALRSAVAGRRQARLDQARDVDREAQRRHARGPQRHRPRRRRDGRDRRLGQGRPHPGAERLPRLDAKVFKDRYPAASVLSPPARARRGPGGGHRWRVRGLCRRPNVELFTFDGTKAREGGMDVRADRDTSLVLNDAVFNMPHAPASPGSSSAGSPIRPAVRGVSRVMKWFVIADKPRSAPPSRSSPPCPTCTDSSSPTTRRSPTTRPGPSGALLPGVTTNWVPP